MKLILSITLLALFSLSSTSMLELNELQIGDQMPLAQQKMDNVLGTQSNLMELNGENGLLVVFSCNTCPFVIGSDHFDGWEKDYDQIYTRASEIKIGMVLINSNEAKRDRGDSIDDMKQRAEEKHYRMPYLLDTDSKLADAFGARTTPHIFLFNKDRKLIYKGAIDNLWDPKRTKDEFYLTQVFNDLSKGQKPSLESTGPKGCSIKRNK
ncbi:MAG: redoxin domain-containing protein [Bacteroidetes bacterium]|nr:MAG: redoxin domain-containing protein [Bacteroidota bacterium]